MSTHQIVGAITLLGELETGQFPAAFLVDENDLRRDVPVNRFQIIVQMHQCFGQLEGDNKEVKKELDFKELTKETIGCCWTLATI